MKVCSRKFFSIFLIKECGWDGCHDYFEPTKVARNQDIRSYHIINLDALSKVIAKDVLFRYAALIKSKRDDGALHSG